jgi:diaminohydroxyphosphoribosylaminopyrimidine deaminase/5-amino-6-(5-phosphoribosylamino)uracil reductase
MVGALVVAGGDVVGRGWHARVGGPHAEAVALAEAGERACGATLYVTLEPCAHHGRTPPCADAVIAAGVRRVVACHGDPDPRVAGRGFARLRAAGIEVEVGELAERAVRLNWKFLVAAVERRPAVTLKWAMSLDGRIATARGESQWISGQEARRWALALREEHDATLVGVGTVLADDPRLDRRLALAAGPGRRVVLDRRLRTPPGARLFAAAGPLLVYAEPGAPEERRRALEAAGATVVELPEVAPAAVLADLYAREVRSVLVEGGGEALASFAAAAFFDQVRVACAPLLLGGRKAPGALGGEGLGELARVPRLDRLAVRRVGRDLVLSALREGCIARLLEAAAGAAEGAAAGAAEAAASRP